jgi:hypothetical protein
MRRRRAFEQHWRETDQMRKLALLIIAIELLVAGVLIRRDDPSINSSASPPITPVPTTHEFAGEPMWQVRNREVTSPADNHLVDDLTRRVRNLLATGDPADQDLAFTDLLPTLIGIDPAAAARLAESLGPGPVRTESLRRVAQVWASSNSADAEAWAAQLPEVSERHLQLSLVLNEVANTNPALAVLEVERLDLGEHTNVMLQHFAQRWAAQDFPAAKAWAMAHPAGEQRDYLLARIALVQSGAAPAEAARLIVDQIAPGQIQVEATISVIRQWAQRDIAGATAWIELFPPGTTKERAEAEISGIAAQQNPL